MVGDCIGIGTPGGGVCVELPVSLSPNTNYQIALAARPREARPGGDDSPAARWWRGFSTGRYRGPDELAATISALRPSDVTITAGGSEALTSAPPSPAGAEFEELLAGVGVLSANRQPRVVVIWTDDGPVGVLVEALEPLYRDPLAPVIGRRGDPSGPGIYQLAHRPTLWTDPGASPVLRTVSSPDHRQQLYVIDPASDASELQIELVAADLTNLDPQSLANPKTSRRPLLRIPITQPQWEATPMNRRHDPTRLHGELRTIDWARVAGHYGQPTTNAPNG